MTERILLIEDDPRLAEMVKNYLGEAGFAVTVSSHGVAGVALEAKEPFDALVLDLMLPDIDGIDLIEQIKEQLKQKSLPVIVHTGPSVFPGATGRHGGCGCLSSSSA